MAREGRFASGRAGIGAGGLRRGEGRAYPGAVAAIKPILRASAGARRPPLCEDRPVHLYLGTALIALATLALEVTLTRLLSVTTWYHLAFFCIATAMLGMTAGAATVYLRPRWFEGERAVRSAAIACLAWAAATPACLVLLCILPLVFLPSLMGVLVFAVATLACALPFYCSGVAISAALTRFGLPTGRLYAADLAGAALGCLLVLGALEVMDAPSLVLLCGALGLAAALALRRGRGGRLAIALGLYALAVAANAASGAGIRPLFIKLHLESADSFVLERWNSFSRVAVYRPKRDAPKLWGPSPLAPKGPAMPQYEMNIDGEAGTVLGRFRKAEDIAFLRFDVTNVAHPLRSGGNVCVIGVGGGRDLQTAVYFGYRRILGVEINPIFVDLLRHRFRDFAGLADRGDVELVVDEARSYLSRTEERFDLIQMSLTDTWAATGAGAFSLSENALYTVEAWQTFLGRLAPGGLFTVSRWYDADDLGETGRMLSLGVAALLADGVPDPSRHLAMFASGSVATLVVSREPLAARDLGLLRRNADALRFDAVVLPGMPPAHPDLRVIAAARSLDALRSAARGRPLDFSPPTDESPYFFQMLPLSRLFDREVGRGQGVLRGNQTALGTLVVLVICLGALTLVTVVLPLARSGAGTPVVWSAAGYFASIGAGFMLLEIGLLQRLSVFLGHPVYALGILLFTLIASTGLGSLWSERLPLDRRPGLLAFPLVALVLIGALRFALPELATRLVAAPTGTKIAVSVLAIAPVGVVLGCFLPVGLGLAQAVRRAETPWYWALNGIAGVLCSALAVLLALFRGVSANFDAAALCYALAGLCLLRVARLRAAAVPARGPLGGA